MQFRVGTFKVYVTRMSANWFARIIELQADPSSASDIQRASFGFWGPEVDWPTEELGYQYSAPANAGYIVGYLDLRDFDDHYRLLQAGKPTYVTWEIDGDNQKLRSLYLSTDSTQISDGMVNYKLPPIPVKNGE